MFNSSKPLMLAAAIAMASIAISGPASADANAMSNQFWWPERLDLKPLRQHAAESNPMGDQFDYAAEFKKLDLDAVKKDIAALMTQSQDRGGRRTMAITDRSSSAWPGTARAPIAWLTGAAVPMAVSSASSR
jgi:hypothetical protein